MQQTLTNMLLKYPNYQFNLTDIIIPDSEFIAFDKTKPNYPYKDFLIMPPQHTINDLFPEINPKLPSDYKITICNIPLPVLRNDNIYVLLTTRGCLKFAECNCVPQFFDRHIPPKLTPEDIFRFSVPGNPHTKFSIHYIKGYKKLVIPDQLTNLYHIDPKIKAVSTSWNPISSPEKAFMYQ